MFNIGGAELLVILLVALLVLGPQKLPEAAKQAGKVMSELRRMSTGFKRELQEALDQSSEAAARDQGQRHTTSKPDTTESDTAPDDTTETDTAPDDTTEPDATKADATADPPKAEPTPASPDDNGRGEASPADTAAEPAGRGEQTAEE